MNDFSQLEAELKQLRPAPASAALVSRIERALSAPTLTAAVLSRPRMPRVNWFAFGSAVAAAATFLVLARPDRHPASSAPPRVVSATPSAQASAPRFVSDGLTRVIYNRNDEGLVFPADAAQPVRRMRSRTRETLHWKNPATGASLRVSYPTEEVEFIPISGQ